MAQIRAVNLPGWLRLRHPPTHPVTALTSNNPNIAQTPRPRLGMASRKATSCSANKKVRVWWPLASKWKSCCVCHLSYISVARVRLRSLSLGFALGVGCLFCSCSHAATPPGCSFLIRQNSELAAFTQSLHTTIRTHKTARWRHADHMFACVALRVSATPDSLDFPPIVVSSLRRRLFVCWSSHQTGSSAWHVPSEWNGSHILIGRARSSPI